MWSPKISKANILLTFLFLLQFLLSCATNPVTGKKELSLLSNDQEIKLGAEADPGIVAQYGLYDDAKIAEFVNQLGQKMARISHRPNLEFHFRVLDSPVINAFALPGGYVYITRGILGYMNSEAELAGVMGHEIGHITARHGAKAYTRAQLAQVGFGVGYIFSDTFRRFSDVAQLGVGLLFLRFSRDQERQSDELGVQYSTTVGYDASDMSHFFGTLNRLQEQSGQSLPGWFSTHPNPADREAKTLQLAREAQQKSTLSEFKVDRAHYLDLINGIVFGEDPRQGFVENGYFYHPTLDFQFPVPTDWQLVNTPQQVQMVNKAQTAAMQFTLSQQATARGAADKFVADNQARVINSASKRVHGFPTEIRESSVSSQQGDLNVLSYFIEKDKYVYVFHGFSSKKDYNNNLNAFKYTMNNFDRLKNQKAKNVQPTRIKVVKVTARSTLKDFLARYPNNKMSADKLAIINGMKLTDIVKPGDRIKVLSR
ncbi:MAG: M48 family metalloprotease [bacterium]